MHASRSPRAKIALMPDLAFPGDLPVRLDDGQAQTRIRALMRILHGKIKPATRAQIGDVARWHGVTVKALHNLEERGITVSERGAGGVRFYAAEQQVRIEVALALRELGATAQDIRDFLELLNTDRGEARAFLSSVLKRRVTMLHERIGQITETLEMIEKDYVL